MKPKIQKIFLITNLILGVLAIYVNVPVLLMLSSGLFDSMGAISILNKIIALCSTLVSLLLFISSVIGLVNSRLSEGILRIQGWLMALPSLFLLVYGTVACLGIVTGYFTLSFSMDLLGVLLIIYVAYFFRTAVLLQKFPDSRFIQKLHWFVGAYTLALFLGFMLAVATSFAKGWPLPQSTSVYFYDHG